MKIVKRGETKMRTEPRTKKIRVQVISAAREQIDPEALWLNQDIAPEELIARDPLDITPEMVEEAEQPESADFALQSLPQRNDSLRLETIRLKLMKAGLRAEYGLPGTFPEFRARLKGSQ
jgi:hypothetical protein